MRVLLNSLLILNLLAVASPAAFMGLSQMPLHVRLYIDEADQDEDVFVEVGDRSENGQSLAQFHDESRRDTGRSLKTLIKRPVKWTTGSLQFEPIFTPSDALFLSFASSILPGQFRKPLRPPRTV